MRTQLLADVDTIILPDFDHNDWRDKVKKSDLGQLIANHFKMIFLKLWNTEYKKC